MADYKELLRRAIAALPENNGAARRAVYEKARSALVGQLRAITPPLPARDITQHRLQLEDCIRQVEQEASEAMISLARNEPLRRETPPAPPPQPVVRAEPEPETPAVERPLQDVQPELPVPEEPQAPPPVPVFVADPEPIPAAVVQSEPEPAPKPAGRQSIEDIIAAAAAANDVSVRPAQDPLPVPPPAVPPEKPQKQGFKLFPSLASRNDSKPVSSPQPNFTPRAVDGHRLAASTSGEALAVAGPGGSAVARRPEPDFVAAPVQPALSSVREVEVDPAAKPNSPRDAEGVIERAIETLDRAARGEETEAEFKPVAEPLPFRARKGSIASSDSVAETEGETPADATAEDRRRGGSGVTIFLIVFALLLAGVGGAGFWAWREGYIDLDQMFGRATVTAEGPDAAATTPIAEAPTLQAPTIETAPTEQTGPGNTTTETALAEPTTALEGIVSEDRLEPTPETPLNGVDTPAAGDDERLPSNGGDIALGNDPAASVDPAILAGSQSLLLEASETGQGGAVPFSGTVEWTKGTDEVGMPTLVATADIPARNLGLTMTIRRNADPSLPASHLMEVDFDIAESFVGGAISGLPGVLLKNEELVQGTPLIGASARVVGNSFLFALSASDADAATNRDLLSDRKWMDLAVIYATGRRAIITLEKDDEADELFREVFAEWQAADNA